MIGDERVTERFNKQDKDALDARSAEQSGDIVVEFCVAELDNLARLEGQRLFLRTWSWSQSRRMTIGVILSHSPCSTKGVISVGKSVHKPLRVEM